MKKILLVAFSLFLLSFFGNVGASTAYPEVSCDQYGTDANSCDQCFDGGSKYVGDTFQPNDTWNSWSVGDIYFDDENPSVYSVRTLNNNTVWNADANLIGYTQGLDWYRETTGEYAGRDYLYFEPNTNTRFLESRAWRSIRFASVANNSVDPKWSKWSRQNRLGNRWLWYQYLWTYSCSYL